MTSRVDPADRLPCHFQAEVRRSPPLAAAAPELAVSAVNGVQQGVVNNTNPSNPESNLFQGTEGSPDCRENSMPDGDTSVTTRSE